MNSLPIEIITDIFRLAVDCDQTVNMRGGPTYRSAYCRIQKRWHRAATLVLHSEIYVTSRGSATAVSTAEQLFTRFRENPELGQAAIILHLDIDHPEESNVRTHLRETIVAPVDGRTAVMERPDVCRFARHAECQAPNAWYCRPEVYFLARHASRPASIFP